MQQQAHPSCETERIPNPDITARPLTVSAQCISMYRS